MNSTPRRFPRTRQRFLPSRLLAVAAACGLVGAVQAADVTWPANVSVNGPGGDDVKLVGNTTVTLSGPTTILESSISNESGATNLLLQINSADATLRTLAADVTSLANGSLQTLTVSGTANFRPGLISDNGQSTIQLVKDGGTGELILDTPQTEEGALDRVQLRVVNGTLSIVGSGGSQSPIFGLGAPILIDGSAGTLRFGSVTGQETTFVANVRANESGTLQHTSAGQDTLSGSVIITAGKTLTANIVAGGLTVDGPLNGPNFTKSGAGQMKVTGVSAVTNSPGAGLVVNGGRLEFAGGVQLNSLPTIAAGATLALTSTTGNVVPAGAFAVPTGTLELVQGAITNQVALTGGTLRLTGSGAFTNVVNASGNSGLEFASASTQQINSLTVQAGTTLTVGVTGADYKLASGTLGTGISLVKTGTGVFDLATTLTSAGTTTINQGTLRVSDGGQLPTGAIANNATLEYTRTGVVTVASAITGTGAVTNAGAGTTLNLNGTQGYHTLNANAGITNLNSSLTDPTAIINVRGTGQLRSTASQKLSALNLGVPALSEFDSSSGFAESAVVPEPGSIGLLALGAVGLLTRRRR